MFTMNAIFKLSRIKTNIFQPINVHLSPRFPLHNLLYGIIFILNSYWQQDKTVKYYFLYNYIVLYIDQVATQWRGFGLLVVSTTYV